TMATRRPAATRRRAAATPAAPAPTMMASTPSGRDVLFCALAPGASAGTADTTAEAARNERRLRNVMADACGDRAFRPRRTLPDCVGHRKRLGRHSCEPRMSLPGAMPTRLNAATDHALTCRAAPAPDFSPCRD